ncbi:hypothetical protein C8Q77DRAFT_1110725 [Trametes polyzona]|nr:hypothetical protein C8Q77DRAFT_1110725 [Trametes polyzona]
MFWRVRGHSIHKHISADVDFSTPDARSQRSCRPRPERPQRDSIRDLWQGRPTETSLPGGRS